MMSPGPGEVRGNGQKLVWAELSLGAGWGVRGGWGGSQRLVEPDREWGGSYPWIGRVTARPQVGVAGMGGTNLREGVADIRRRSPTWPARARGALPFVAGRGRRPRSRSQSREAGRSGRSPTRPSRRHESRGAARHPGQRHRSVGRGRAGRSRP